MKLTNAGVLIAIVIITAHGDAKGQLLGKIDLGGKAGVNVVKIVGPDADGTVVKNANKLAFSVGAVGSYSIHRFLAVQGEVLFSTKGTRDVSPIGDDGGEDLYYIDIPLLAKIPIPLGIQVEPYLLVGSGFGILLHAVADDADGTRVDITKNRSTLDIGPIVGAGGAYSLGSRGVVLFEARYFRGLTTLHADRELDFYNRTFTFMVGYQCCASAARK